MENRSFVIPKRYKILVGGALIGAFFIAGVSALAYNQHTTHPALTDETVDFYNAANPQKALTYQQKQWLIKGSSDEDNGVRPLFHFYDPVNNRGLAMVAGASSKDWGFGSDFQASILGKNLPGFLSFLDNSDEEEFSYQRAIKDYAQGNYERAFIGFGHILHLLQDAGVPDHTRDDPHPPFLDDILHQASPYEETMGKWNPDNFRIADSLIASGVQPAARSGAARYLDAIAHYSNGYFFSKDTINNAKYSLPDAGRIGTLKVNGAERLVVVGRDEDGRDFPLAFVETEVVMGQIRIKDYLLASPTIGSSILDGYWDRLSKKIIINSAGALKLFLEEAEQARLARLPIGGDKIGDTYPQVTNTLPTPHMTPVSLVSPISSPIMTPSPKVSPTPKLIPTPSATPSPTPKTTPLPDYQYIEVMAVQDGDTIQTVDGRFVRLIGINAPEKDEYFYGQAKQKLAELILNKIVRLDKDKSENDDYGRRLRYVYLRDTVFINLEMVKGGYARALNIPPDTKFAGQFKEAETAAKSKCLGLWNAPGGSCKPKEGEESDNAQVLGENIATKGRVVINEIAWMGTIVSANHEWLELYNTEDEDILLAGWTLKSGDGSPSVTFPDDLVIKAKSYLLLERTSDASVPNIQADYIYSGALNNTGEMLMLADGDGVIVDVAGRINEAWFAGEASAKKTMERINASSAGDTASNWKNGPVGGTPKSANSIGSNNSSTSGGQQVTPTPSVSPSPMVTPSPTPSVSPTVSPSPSDDTNDTGDVDNVTNDDTETDEDEEISVEIEAPGDSAVWGEIVINEVAWMGTANDLVNDEWIELYNTTDRTINISGWRLKSTKGENPTPDIILKGEMASKSYFLLERTDDTTIADIPADQLYSGALGDEGETLELRDVNDNNIDVVLALDAWPAGDKNTRSSMERKDPFSSGGDPLNWHTNDGLIRNGQNAQGGIINGTPKSPNSQGIAEPENSQEDDDDDVTETGDTNPAIAGEIAWEFEAGQGIGQPAADSQGNIYLPTVYAGLDRLGKVIKINPNGQEEWAYETGLSPSEPKALGDTVYFGGLGGGVQPFTALNADGTVKWVFYDAARIEKFDISPSGEAHFAHQSGMRQVFEILNPDGTLKKQFDDFGTVFGVVVTPDNHFYLSVVTGGGNPAFVRHNGEVEIFGFAFPQGYGHAPMPPTIDDSGGASTLYSAVGRHVIKVAAMMLFSAEVSQENIWATTEVAIGPDTLYIGFRKEDGTAILYAYDKSTLTEKWRFVADSEINERIALDQEGNLYFSTRAGKLYSLDSAGHQNWVLEAGTDSPVSPVLTPEGLLWGYGTKLALVK